MIRPRSPRRFRHYGSPVKEESMFGQMRSSRRQGPVKPCPCGGICSCHSPTKESWGLIAFLFALPFILIIGFFALFSSHHSYVRHIDVNGQDCIIQNITDGCTSTGACRGHDVAICPTEKNGR